MNNATDTLSAKPVDSNSGGGRRSFIVAYVLVTSLFFMWAIALNLNDILIKQFEKALQLFRVEASFIQVAFYIAYLIFALPAGYVMKRIGLQRTMVLGLALYGAGAIAFYPAAEIGTFGTFLTALFVMASGIVCLEIAAGAFIVLGGAPERSAFRINLAQAFNGLGAVVSPIIGGLFILSGVERSPDQMAKMSPANLTAFRAFELHQVQTPYLVIGIVALAIALLIGMTRFPAESLSKAKYPVSYGRLFRERTFTGAVAAQFFHVGAQIAAWSFFIDFVKDARPDIDEQALRKHTCCPSASSLFMVGRFTGFPIAALFEGADRTRGLCDAGVLHCGRGCGNHRQCIDRMCDGPELLHVHHVSNDFCSRYCGSRGAASDRSIGYGNGDRGRSRCAARIGVSCRSLRRASGLPRAPHLFRRRDSVRTACAGLNLRCRLRGRTLFLRIVYKRLKLNMPLMSTGLEFVGGDGWRRLAGQYCSNTACSLRNPARRS